MSNYQDDVKKAFGAVFEEDAYGKAVEENAKNNGKSLTEEEKNELKRLNFPPEVRVTLGARVGFICSYPNCNQVTLGPKDDDKFVILGEAAHIYGATKPKDGTTTRIPRPANKPEIDDEYIKSLENGIWLCRHHHRLIDAIWSEEEHTPNELKNWKKEAESRQKQDLAVPEHKTMRKFFERLDEFHSDYVDVNDFDKADWLLILYMEESHGEKNMADYVSWLIENGIKPIKAGIEQGYGYYGNNWQFRNPEDRLNHLASIIGFSGEENGFYTGENFELLVNDLYNIDPNYHEMMLDELKTKY